MEEDIEENEGDSEDENAGGNLLSEGFIMFIMAIIFDLSWIFSGPITFLLLFIPIIGFLLSFFAGVFIIMINLLATLLFGIWMLIRSGSAKGAISFWSSKFTLLLLATGIGGAGAGAGKAAGGAAKGAAAAETATAERAAAEEAQIAQIGKQTGFDFKTLALSLFWTGIVYLEMKNKRQ